MKPRADGETWQHYARHLHNEGLSALAIGKIVGKHGTTVLRTLDKKARRKAVLGSRADRKKMTEEDRAEARRIARLKYRQRKVSLEEREEANAKRRAKGKGLKATPVTAKKTSVYQSSTLSSFQRFSCRCKELGIDRLETRIRIWMAISEIEKSQW